MKVLKITGVLILVLLLGFLAIGFIAGKHEYSAEVVINRPVSEVFADFNNHEKFKQWLPEVKSFEPIKETENKIGSEYKMVVEHQGKAVELYETLTGFRENEMVEMVFVIGWMTKTIHFTFEKSDDGTILKGNYSVTGNNVLAKSMFAFFSGMFQEIDQTNLNRFKDFMEKQPVFIETETPDPVIVN